MRETIDYYNANVKKFFDDTASVNFTCIQNTFLKLLPKRATILDFGCGSGRDTKYFLEQGCIVEAVDGSLAVCEAASKYTGIRVKQMLFQELNEKKYMMVFGHVHLYCMLRGESYRKSFAK